MNNQDYHIQGGYTQSHIALYVSVISQNQFS